MRLSSGTVIAVLLLTAACGPLPQPFEHGAKGAAYPLAELAIDVRVAPVGGLPASTGEALAKAVAENLGAYGVTAASQPGAASRFVLRGTYGPDDDAVVWTLYDADGEVTGIHTQAIEVPPADAGAVRAAGWMPAKALAALIGIDAGLTAVADPLARQGVFLTGVTGAPGDGDTALAKALRQALKDSPFGSVDANAAAHFVRGTVTAAPLEDGRQRITIRWQVTDTDGREVGEANQENIVPAGRLDRRWGGVAVLAAQAAADGIAEIVRQAGEDGDAPPTDGRPSIVLPPSGDLPPPAGP
jgi:hypothetical protein